jgi:hypothetical protein
VEIEIVNKWRIRNRPDRGGPIADQDKDDGGSANSELTKSAGDIYDVAAEHRKAVIAKDKAAKARRRKK